MKGLKYAALALVLVAVIAMFIPAVRVEAQQVGSQVLLAMKFVNAGPQAKGASILQTGEVSTLSAATSNTIAKVVTAPAAGSIYLRGIVVEKVSGATNTVLLSTGTGTNCGTGTAVLLGPITNAPVGYIPLGIQVTAVKDLCVTTDGATTVVRVLAQ